MAWFGDGLPSLSNLKGQLSNFTKDVLSEGIVEEIDDRTKELNAANERCVQLQELLNSKDAEISLLRRQNCELQRAVVELNTKPKDSNDVKQDDEGEVFFWDPPSAKNRNSKSQNHMCLLQEQLAQATVRIRDLESELKHVQKVNTPSLKDEIPDGHQKAEFLRAKQDMVNRIIQLEEKNREAERNTKRIQLDETTLISDFRTVISTLDSLEKLDLLRGALKALETENAKYSKSDKQEKSDFDEKFNSVEHESVPLKPNFDKRHDGFPENASNKESDLRKKVEELQMENKRLFTSIEELDQQHGESIDKVLSLKEEVEKKHQCLQKAYEQLYVDYNRAQEKVSELEGKFAAAESSASPQIETISHSIQTTNLDKTDKDVQTCGTETNDASEAQSVEKLTQKFKEILKNSCIDAEPGESVFETVAWQYVDVKWKKDLLERKVTEITRDLKEAVEVKDTLQLECDDMQAHIDTLLLEIQDLKLNLPSIPEASEERVASLETETESLHEDVKRLQDENQEMRKENLSLQESVQNLATSLRNQESLEAEIRNTKQQLDIAKQQLDGASKNVEDNESAMEDMRRRLHASLDENNDLRKKIDCLESAGKQLQEQLRASLDRCKDLGENIEFIDELKLDLENVKQKLESSVSNAKRLEDNMILLQEAKNEFEQENEQLFQKNERLESELTKWREISLKNEKNDTLKNLQEELNKVVSEKDNLEYDITNMRKELDETLGQVESKECQVLKLSQENENLAKEKDSLLEQLNATHDESDDKIELLNTEVSLLEQEHAELKQEAEMNETELIRMREKLHSTEEKYAKLESEFNERCDMINIVEKLQSENENLQAELKTMENLKNELDCKSSAVGELSEKLNSVQSESTQLKNEIGTLRSKEEELQLLRENFAKVVEQNVSMKAAQEDLENKCQQLQNEIESLKSERQKLLSNYDENVNDEKEQELLAILEEMQRENDTLKSNNNKLMAEMIESQNRLQEVVEGNKESADMAKQTIEGLSHLIKEKDEEINTLKASLDHVQQVSSEASESFATMKSERDELVKLVTVKHNESLQYHAEIQKLTHLLNEQTTRIQSLISEQSESASALAQGEADLLWTRNELQVLQQRLKNIEDSDGDKETCNVVEHSTQSVEVAILREKSNALEAALIQEQSNNRMLQNQLTESQSKEANAAKELERLRSHLVEIESSYTEEALLVEETRKELEAKLLQAEEKMKNSSTVYTSASIRANQQVETLQQQMALIVQQRDDIQNKLSAAEDKVLSQTASLTNLQIVLEQFQQDKERDILAATGRIQARLNDSYKRQEELTHEVANLKLQVNEAKECLLAASRLTEQLDKKTERVAQLSEEVERLTELVNTADRRIEEAKQSGEGKVDKTLIKNLFLGYLTSSAADKSSVLRVFATILDFNETERDKSGLNNTNAQNSWFSRLSTGSTVPSKDQEASLSAAFVRFLESESKPKPQLPALPIQTSPLPRPGHSRQHSTSSTQSTLLLSNVNLPTFPDFIPARNTGSILKEVLKDS